MAGGERREMGQCPPGCQGDGTVMGHPLSEDGGQWGLREPIHAPRGLAPRYPWGSAHPPSSTHIPKGLVPTYPAVGIHAPRGLAPTYRRVWGSAHPPSGTQGFGVLPTPHWAPTYAEFWGPAHPCLAPIYPGLWGTPHPSSSTRHPTTHGPPACIPAPSTHRHWGIQGPQSDVWPWGNTRIKCLQP